MDGITGAIGNNWWMVFPLGALLIHWTRSGVRTAGRGHRRRQARRRVRADRARAAVPDPGELRRLIDAHEAVNRRWLDYELDVGKLIDFPLMTDVREPLTVAFLRAKRDADGLRPEDAAQPPTPAHLAEYRAAVRSFEVAFDVAEREARRIRDSHFAGPERERLATARKLLRIAADAAATPAERQAAYRRVRRELDGLIALPDAARAALDQGAAGRLGGAPPPAPPA
ncbi:hypothetical protein ACTWLI_14490 [Arthrobacter sp. Hor0625]|uniref:hypothetical protein n=1 Tax=Arthrobacter sp. Hor0625 TaxID=3457358 RepID=UPI00403E86DD